MQDARTIQPLHKESANKAFMRPSLLYSFFRYIFLFSLLLISGIGLIYSSKTFPGSHFHALLQAEPLLYLFPVLFSATSIFLILFSKRWKAEALLFALFWGVPFGESCARFGFHIVVITLITKCILDSLITDTRKVDRQTDNRNDFPQLVVLTSLVFFLINLSGLFTALWFTLDLPMLYNEWKSSDSLHSFINSIDMLNITRDSMMLLEFLTLAFFFSYMKEVFSYSEFKRALAKVLLTIFLILPFFLFFQIEGFHAIFSLNQNAFWNYSGRYAGTFSDPNAFGIMSGLFLVLIPYLYQNLYLRIILTALVLGSSVFSGSRTFFIFLVLFLAFHTLQFFCQQFKKVAKYKNKFSIIEKIRFGYYGIVAAFAAFLIIIRLYAVKPPSIVRVLDTINPDKISSMLESRMIFSRIALEAIRENPLHGVGLGRFIPVQEEIARSLSIDLLNWRDNANNFYLHIAAEEGIPALILIIFLFYRLVTFRKKNKTEKNNCGNATDNTAQNATSNAVNYYTERRSIQVALSIFMLTLLVGPHLFFIEVRNLFFILVLSASYLEQPAFMSNKEYREKCSFILRPAFPLCLYILFASLFSPWWFRQTITQGLYPKELEGSYEFQWTGYQAKNIRLDHNEEKNRLFLKNPLAIFQDEEQSSSRTTSIIFYTQDFILLNQMDLETSQIAQDWFQIEIPPNAFSFDVQPSGIVIPKKLGISTDPRPLGVMVSFR